MTTEETHPQRRSLYAEREPLPPRSFGRYQPIAVLGYGGMAAVYLASALGPANFTKLVVVKELRPELAQDPDFREMFLDEARIAARLHHPNVVQTYEVMDDPAMAIVMEYLDGQPLSRVRQRMNVTAPEVLPLMARSLADMLRGLHYAHDLADFDGTPLLVVHRDVSPQNVFVTYAGETKVVDFGVAKVADASSRTRTGVVKGKLSYMSPEQALGERLDRRADVFAAGLMLWEMIAGRRIWKGLEDVILGRLNAGRIPRIREACPEVDPKLEAIVQRAIAADPADRYPSAAEFQADLEAWLARLPVDSSAQLLATRMGEAFANERESMRTIIDQQLKAIRSAPPGQIPLLRLPEPLADKGSAPTKASTPSSLAEEASGLSARTTTDQWNKHTALSSRIEAVEPGRSRLRTALCGGAVAVVGLFAIGLGAALLLGRTAPPAASGPAATEPSSEAPPSSAPAESSQPPPRKHTLSFRVTPAHASLELDGRVLERVSEQIVVAHDPSTHLLKLSCKGFVPQTVAIAFDDDRVVEVKLVRVKAGAPVRPGQAGEPDLGF